MRSDHHLVEAMSREGAPRTLPRGAASVRGGARAAALLASLLLAAPLAAPLAAQDDAQPSEPLGRLEGTVRETMRPRSVQDARIMIARVAPEPAVAFDAQPDARGHYVLDSLPAGRYMIQLGHELLDSLGLSLPIEEIDIVGGETVTMPFSLPSSTALRNAVCRGLTLAKGTGAVVGRVVDADTEQPLADADVAISWREISVDRSTMRPSAEDHEGWVRTGPRGEYRICNVPTESWLLVQLQYDGRAGNALRVSVSGEEGVVVRDLSLSVSEAPTLAMLDSVGATVRGLDREPIAADDSTIQLALTGTASVTGIVRGDEGRPLPGVEIRVVNAQPATRTDDVGRFTLHGLPAGTQLLAVRRIGYLIGDVAVELRAGRMLRRDVTLRRVVSLDSIRVVGRRNRYADFEYRRKNSPVGRFVTASEIQRQHPGELGIFVQHLGGFYVDGVGPYAHVFSNSARAGRHHCGEANVVIDGVDQASINFTPPNEIAAMEVYPEAAGAPAQYHAECGLIVIWTKKYGATPPT
jgi:hypothetical protein